MARARAPPTERVRQRLARRLGAELAATVPPGYQRVGRVLLVRVPDPLWPHREALGEAWREELGVETVLARTGPVEGELREPTVVPIAGGSTVTEVVEHGVRWRFDASKVLFAQGNRTERRRAALLVRPRERVADLFAGIGYFAVPAARADPSVTVDAVEKNPVSFRYLEENAQLNGVADRLTAHLGDNREVALPPGRFDRVFLGWLPDATPWLDRALELVDRCGGTVHVHLVAEVHEPLEATAARVAGLARDLGAEVDGAPFAREVKPYGPGRRHVVVDVRTVPRT